MSVIIQLRGDTAANWTSVNPILAEREFALETDTRKYKIGDGTTYWTGLTYSSIDGVLTVTAGNYITNSGTAADPILDLDANIDLTSLSANTIYIGSDDITGLFAPKTISYEFVAAASDETTAITTGVAKLTFISPASFTVTGVTASLTTAGTTLSTVDVNKAGTTIFSTAKLTIDANEKNSTTAATPAVITGGTWNQFDEITVDIDGAGTDAAGLKLLFTGTKTL